MIQITITANYRKLRWHVLQRSDGTWYCMLIVAHVRAGGGYKQTSMRKQTVNQMCDLMDFAERTYGTGMEIERI